MRSLKWLACLGPLAFITTLLGCNPDSLPNPNVTPDGGAAELAYINVVHAIVHPATEATALDLYIDDQRTAPGLEYRKSTGNQKITPLVEHKLELRVPGRPSTDSPLLKATINLLPGSKTLLMALGRSRETAGPTQPRLVAAPYGTADPKSVKLRLFNGAPVAPALDLAAGNNVVAGGAGFGSPSGYGSVALLPAATKLGLRSTQTATDLAYVTLPAMATPGAVLTVIALGELSPVSDDRHFLAASVLDEGSGFLIDLPLDINAAGPKGSLILVNASPDAPAADLADDMGSKLVTNVAYQKASRLVELAAGNTRVTLQSTVGAAQLLPPLSLKLLPAMGWTLLFHGSKAFVTKTPPQLTALPRPLDAQTGWRLANVFTDAPVLQVTAAGKPLFDALGYGQASPVSPTALPDPILGLRTAAAPKQGFDVAVPQMVLDAAQGQLATLVTTGTFATAMQPIAVLAVLDNSATAAMEGTVLPLMTTPVTIR